MIKCIVDGLTCKAPADRVWARCESVPFYSTSCNGYGQAWSGSAWGDLIQSDKRTAPGGFCPMTGAVPQSCVDSDGLITYMVRL